MAPWSSSSSSSLSVYQHKARVCTRKVRKEGSPGTARRVKAKDGKSAKEELSPGQKEARQRAAFRAHSGRHSSPLPLSLSGNFFFLLPLRERQKSTGYQEGAADLRASFCASFSSECVERLCQYDTCVRVCEYMCVRPLPTSLHSPALLTTTKPAADTRAHFRLK